MPLNAKHSSSKCSIYSFHILIIDCELNCTLSTPTEIDDINIFHRKSIWLVHFCRSEKQRSQIVCRAKKSTFRFERSFFSQVDILMNNSCDAARIFTVLKPVFFLWKKECFNICSSIGAIAITLLTWWHEMKIS